MSDMPHTSAIRCRIQWVLLILFGIVWLMFLGSAAYSAWVSADPSNPYALGWSRRALGHFCYAASVMFVGLGLSRGIQTYPVATKRSAVLFVLGGLLAFVPYAGRFLLSDGCLDRGGSWYHVALQCSD